MLQIRRKYILILIIATIGAYYIFLHTNQIILFENTTTVQHYHWQKMIVTYEKNSRINIEFEVIEGAPVDLIIFNKTGYNEFYYIMNQNIGLFQPLTAELNTTVASIQANMPSGWSQ